MTHMTNHHSYETIVFDYDKGVATITLNKPERLNSFTTKMHEELRTVMCFLNAEEDLRGVILTGKGRGFCAGQDLTERKPLKEGKKRDLSVNLEKNYNPLVLSMRALPVPIVCFVNGVAAGAGFSLAMACDILIATKSASFIQAFSKIGLAPDAGSTYFLPRIIGTKKALAMSLLAKPISTEKALEWGIIWEVIEDEDLPHEIELMKSLLSSGPTCSFAAIKELIYSSERASLEEQLDSEKKLQKQLGFTEDYREGVMAFLEKRSPNFKGK